MKARISILCGVLVCSQIFADRLPAQALPAGWPEFAESVTLDADGAVVRKLAPLGDYLEERQWERAVALLEEVERQHGDELIRVEIGRYMNVADFCHTHLQRLPAEGLAAYRSKADPQAQRWFEAAQRVRDEKLMRRVVQQTFASSFGDDALLALGDWAWERGDFDAARSDWTKLLPEPRRPDTGEPLNVLRYPDADVGQAPVLARLVLASLMDGREKNQGERELRAFRDMYPDAQGPIAGRSGNLAEILQEVADNSQAWQPATPAFNWRTFAGNAARNGSASHSIDVGAPIWSVALQPNGGNSNGPRPALDDGGPLSYHAAVVKDMVFVAEAHRISCFHRLTGAPYFAGGDGVIYTESLDGLAPRPSQQVVGVPRYTVTIHQGRLYARIGSAVTARAHNELRPLTNHLICLDLADRQGDLKWKTPPPGPAGEWSFEGTPLASEDRVYVALRSNRPQTELAVACYRADTGQVVWNRRVCAAIPEVSRERNYISHQLLTLGGGSLFYSTDLGAVAALDIHEGTLRWVVTYESQRREPDRLSDHMQQGLLPCLYERGMVFAAPNDSDQVLAIDAVSGLVLWSRRLPRERIRNLLGVGHGNLIVSGNSLWALDAQTGRIAWGAPELDPEFFGYGRGLLVENDVWWPTREHLLVVDQRTGRRTRAPINLRQKTRLREFGETAGNLVLAGGTLLIAQPDRLVAFGEYALPAAEPQDVLSRAD